MPVKNGGTAITTLNIATTRRYRNAEGQTVSETEWHRVVLFSRLAEIAKEYLHKGSQCYIEGRLRTRKYEDKQGIERWTTEIIADQLQLLRQKDDKDAKPARAKPAAQRRDPEPAYDSDVPF